MLPQKVSWDWIQKLAPYKNQEFHLKKTFSKISSKILVNSPKISSVWLEQRSVDVSDKFLASVSLSTFSSSTFFPKVSREWLLGGGTGLDRAPTKKKSTSFIETYIWLKTWDQLTSSLFYHL